jgi:hypothetical protein
MTNKETKQEKEKTEEDYINKFKFEFFSIRQSEYDELKNANRLSERAAKYEEIWSRVKTANALERIANAAESIASNLTKLQERLKIK